MDYIHPAVTTVREGFKTLPKLLQRERNPIVALAIYIYTASVEGAKSLAGRAAPLTAHVQPLLANRYCLVAVTALATGGLLFAGFKYYQSKKDKTPLASKQPETPTPAQEENQSITLPDRFKEMSLNAIKKQYQRQSDVTSEERIAIKAYIQHLANAGDEKAKKILPNLNKE